MFSVRFPLGSSWRRGLGKMEPFTIHPIGVISNPITETADERWGTVVSRIRLRADLGAGLRGLEEFSHALVITYLHEAAFERERHLVRRPRGLDSMPLVGIFAQRAKDRPNPLGITVVRILEVARDYLDVQGLDAIDGTPVLDIKPHMRLFDSPPDAREPEWVERLMRGYF